jgi:phage terminase Nu1 subunit (DNA packaging protein)
VEEQLEQLLEDLLEENGGLKLANQQLQGLVAQLRRDFLQERVWRTKFQIIYLEGLQAEAEAELREMTHGR